MLACFAYNTICAFFRKFQIYTAKINFLRFTIKRFKHITSICPSNN